MNIDQGSQFTSPKYIQLLKKASVQISLDGRGRAQDKIFTERLIKYEEVYLHEYGVPGKQDEEWVNTLPSITTSAYTRHLPIELRQKFTMLSLPGFPDLYFLTEFDCQGLPDGDGWRRPWQATRQEEVK